MAADAGMENHRLHQTNCGRGCRGCRYQSKGFIRREHVGKSYADEAAAKLAISESFRVWSRNTAQSVAVAVVYIDEPPDPREPQKDADPSTLPPRFTPSILGGLARVA